METEVKAEPVEVGGRLLDGERILLDGREFVSTIPSPTGPGFMRRALAFSDLSEALSSGFSRKSVMALLEYLAEYVVPVDGSDPVEALLDLSEDGFTSLAKTFQGKMSPKAEKASP